MPRIAIREDAYLEDAPFWRRERVREPDDRLMELGASTQVGLASGVGLGPDVEGADEGHLDLITRKLRADKRRIGTHLVEALEGERVRRGAILGKERLKALPDGFHRLRE